MNLQLFIFPKDSIVQPTNKKLLDAAKKAGFYNANTPYNSIFSDLFFTGGTVVFKPEIKNEFRNKVWNYIRSLMQSREPKHEEKEAVCAYLLSEIVLPELAK